MKICIPISVYVFVFVFLFLADIVTTTASMISASVEDPGVLVTLFPGFCLCATTVCANMTQIYSDTHVITHRSLKSVMS